MSPVAIMLIIFLVLLFLKVPVFVSVLSGATVYFLMTPEVPAMVFTQRVTSGMQGIALLAIPFFVAVGVFMNYSSITKRVMDVCNVATGRLWGGLAQVNILLSTLMGGMSGSALADAAMQAKMLVPEMEKKGFSKEFSSAVTAASAMITPLIPPGIAMILYGTVTNVSVGRLFVAGIGPGILLCASMMFMVSRISRKKGYTPTRSGPLPKGEGFKAFKKAFLPLCMPFLIIGSIRLGICTATEAGSVAIVFSLVLGIVYREMNLKKFMQGIKETVLTSSSIMMIVGAASLLGWILTRERIPQTITEFIANSIHSKYLFLVLVNIFLLVVGMFIEGNAAIIIVVPLLAPVAAAYGINEVHFAMVVIFNMFIGGLTPPMGATMFVTCAITKCKVKDFLTACFPFYLLMLGCLLIITFFPPVTTLLVDLIY